MSDLINKLRKYPNMMDCQDAALALEQAISLLRRSVTENCGSDYNIEVNYFLNTWDRNEEEE